MKFIFLSFILCWGCSTGQPDKDKQFSESAGAEQCSFSATGQNTYFILEPGFRLILEGTDGKSPARLMITVLNETKKIGAVETRIVEEHESVNGRIVEISRNFFAVCNENNSVYYFGEETDIYKDGKIISHEGAWEATGKNKPGIIMPGLVLLGSRYYQEIAPGVAMDRAEIVSVGEEFTTPAGKFINVLKTEETTPLEPGDREFKLYAPGIGLIKDGNLVLINYGFIK